MEKIINTGREAIVFLGKEIYGDKFNLDDKDLIENYKTAYEYFLKEKQKR